jgi:adenine-specific DNA-methyltransferase
MAVPLRFVRDLRALQRLVQPAQARSLSITLLSRIARHFAPRLRLPRYHCQPLGGATKLIERLACFLIQHPLEESAYFLSCIYAVICDPDYRRDLAMYFTPPSLARHIVGCVAGKSASLSGVRVMDPACGGAAFLLPTVMLLRDQLRARKASADEIIESINRQVIGIERDPTLAELAHQFIRIALQQELMTSRISLKPIVRIGDALALFRRGRLPKVNVLICNPPYRKIGASELPRFQRDFADSIVGQPNLYAMFMRTALQVVAPGGLIALLTPTSYFSGATYQPIRDHYCHKSQVLRIDLIHERDNLFLGVEHDVAALLVRRRLSGAVQQRPEIFAWNERTGWATLGQITIPVDGSPWHLPRDDASASALAVSRNSTWSLKEYGYRARVGVYVWNRDSRKTLSARPPGPERTRTVPVIWATQIGQDGKFRFISKGRKEKRARYVLLRENDRRGVIDRDCVLLQRTSSRAQRRRLVAAPLPKGFASKHGGFVGENHVIILEPTSGRPVLSKALLAQLLNSDFMRDLYSTTSGTTAVTTSGLNALPLPDPEVLKTRLKKQGGANQAVRFAFQHTYKLDIGRRANAQASSA